MRAARGSLTRSSRSSNCPEIRRSWRGCRPVFCRSNSRRRNTVGFEQFNLRAVCATLRFSRQYSRKTVSTPGGFSRLPVSSFCTRANARRAASSSGGSAGCGVNREKSSPGALATCSSPRTVNAAQASRPKKPAPIWTSSSWAAASKCAAVGGKQNERLTQTSGQFERDSAETTARLLYGQDNRHRRSGPGTHLLRVGQVKRGTFWSQPKRFPERAAQPGPVQFQREDVLRRQLKVVAIPRFTAANRDEVPAVRRRQHLMGTTAVARTWVKTHRVRAPLKKRGGKRSKFISKMAPPNPGYGGRPVDHFQNVPGREHARRRVIEILNPRPP